MNYQGLHTKIMQSALLVCLIIQVALSSLTFAQEVKKKQHSVHKYKSSTSYHHTNVKNKHIPHPFVPKNKCYKVHEVKKSKNIDELLNKEVSPKKTISKQHDESLWKSVPPPVKTKKPATETKKPEVDRFTIKDPMIEEVDKYYANKNALNYPFKNEPSNFKSKKCFNGIIAIGGGAAQSSQLGISKTFPIINPLTDEFFKYKASNKSQTAAMFEGLVGVEWAFDPHWSFQVGLDYAQTLTLKAQGRLLQGADLQSSDQLLYHYHIITRQLLAEGKLLYGFGCGIHPYIMAGAGKSFNYTDSYVANIPLFLTFTRKYHNNNATAFSYIAGVGVDVDIIEHLRLGVGYRYAQLGTVTLGSARIDTTRVTGTLSQSHLYLNEALVQLTFVI